MKLYHTLDQLSQEELEQFERDLKEGAVQKYIERKKEFFKIKDKQCPVCGNTVDVDCFVLIWGEPSIRKKAHFCGTDCLAYFINTFIKRDSTSSSKKKPEPRKHSRPRNNVTPTAPNTV